MRCDNEYISDKYADDFPEELLLIIKYKISVLERLLSLMSINYKFVTNVDNSYEILIPVGSLAIKDINN